MRRQLAVVIAYRSTGSAAAAVRQQRKVRARLQPMDLAVRSEQSELHEMVAARAGGFCLHR